MPDLRPPEVDVQEGGLIEKADVSYERGAMDRITLELPVIGVRVLKAPDDVTGAREYHGASWCDAVRLATYGEELVVRPGSIETCRWSPIVLGLKEPENEFESGLEPRLKDMVEGVYLAPLWRFEGTPDVLIVRGRPQQIEDLAGRLGDGAMSEKYRGQIGRTALGVGGGGMSARVMLSQVSNRALAVLRHWRRFDEATRVLFKDYRVTGLFEKVAKNAVADMSVCRNSTILPYIEDAGNISFFCTGGVTWGCNSPANMTSGFPARLAEKVLEHLEFPGKP
jgi:uncharacterized protein (DUF169 family)